LAARNPARVESMGDEVLPLAQFVVVNEKRIRIIDANGRKKLR